ncbi:MAG TPA: carbon starvation CstA family protein [Candidatus Binataceae bacterium]|nr:carbon starvation CstA family protein [Candidatus Binataceae bacterium]
MKLLRYSGYAAVATLSAYGLAVLALARGETRPSTLWFIIAAVCVYVIGYRFYSGFIARRVLELDNSVPTPAVRLNNGRDYVPTARWITFGHHFAAIAGPGPLVGPVLAAQFGYLPSTLWIVIGAVLGGCVQDFTILSYSLKRDGRSLGKMARDEIGPVGGFTALAGVLLIMVILIAVLGLVVVNAMKHSTWATSTVAATVPIAIFVGIYMTLLRPGRIVEGSIAGAALIVLAVWGGRYTGDFGWGRWFDADAPRLALWIIAYGFFASVLPIWMLLAPRDFLSAFIKIGTIAALALGIVAMRPVALMPALTRFTDGSGPVFAGKVFPFAFITVACGAISGFHALIASGTTPRMLERQGDARLVGYGCMMIESFVAIMAMIAAVMLKPGVYFAINAPAGVAGSGAAACARITAWGFPVTSAEMQNLVAAVGETTLFSRTGGAPSLAVGMAHIFAGSRGGHTVIALWYHFAIMFEALFILSTLDAGTRVARFMLQDLLGNLWRPLADSGSYANILLTSFLIVAAWGCFLYFGTIDPLGGINSLWPLFGVANQMLATIALCVATSAMISPGQGALRLGHLGAPLVAGGGRDDRGRREDLQPRRECRFFRARGAAEGAIVGPGGRRGACQRTCAAHLERSRGRGDDRAAYDRGGRDPDGFGSGVDQPAAPGASGCERRRGGGMKIQSPPVDRSARSFGLAHILVRIRVVAGAVARELRRLNRAGIAPGLMQGRPRRHRARLVKQALAERYRGRTSCC